MSSKRKGFEALKWEKYPGRHGRCRYKKAMSKTPSHVAAFDFEIGEIMGGIQITEYHPLVELSWFKFLGGDPRFGVPLYRTTTKLLSDVVRRAELVPHTQVLWAPESTSEKAATIICWFRKNSRAEITDAIATLTMMGKEKIVVARSFNEP